MFFGILNYNVKDIYFKLNIVLTNDTFVKCCLPLILINLEPPDSLALTGPFDSTQRSTIHTFIIDVCIALARDTFCRFRLSPILITLRPPTLFALIGPPLHSP